MCSADRIMSKVLFTRKKKSCLSLGCIIFILKKQIGVHFPQCQGQRIEDFFKKEKEHHSGKEHASALQEPS